MARGKKRSYIICPHCLSPDYKTLGANSTTRCCGRKVFRVNGKYYRSRDESPEWRIICRFVEMKRAAGSPKYEIVYAHGEYDIAVTMAETLFEKCKKDIDLALKIVELTFTAYPWRENIGLWSVVSNKFFSDVRSKARSELELEREHEHRQQVRSEMMDQSWVAAYESARRV